MVKEKKKVVLALGGNAIMRPGQVGTFAEQEQNIALSSQSISKIIEADFQLVIVHGNGPQVGQILAQNEQSASLIPQHPLASCSAQTQGSIGFMLQSALKNKFPTREVAAIITLVEVDPADSAFATPTKPIGTFYSESEAEALTVEKGWILGEDAGRGYRRLVPSPAPVNILESQTIKHLLASDVITIACGGGGVPVVKTQGNYQGVEAVIDKDLAALKLAQEIKADVLMILTDVPNVYINYGQDNQKKLTEVRAHELQEYYNEGQFAAGSMAPKVKACLDFVQSGKKAIICSIEEGVLALNDLAGTRVISN